MLHSNERQPAAGAAGQARLTISALARSLPLDLRIILVSAVALLISVATGDVVRWLGPVRIALGLAFTLVVPGYSLAAALLPRADDLSSPARAGMSYGLSLALVPVLTLLLDRLSWGIRLWPILCGVYIETAIFMAIAVWRRARVAPADVGTPKPTWHPRAWWEALPPSERRLHMLLAGGILLAGVWMAWSLLFAPPHSSATEFYILGKAGLAEDYPREAAVGELLTVTMGINNREQGTQTYRVEVWVVDPRNPSRRERVLQDSAVTVQQGQTLERTVSWGMPWAGKDQQVEFLLFAGASAQPHRELRLRLNVIDPQVSSAAVTI